MHSVGFFAGRHVLRWLLLLVVLGPLARALSRHRIERGGDPRAVWRTTLRLRYAVVGLLLGGTWIWRSQAPLWEHAVRLVVVMLVVAPALSWIRRRARPTSDQPPRSRTHIWYWLGAKLALIVAGSLVQLGLEQAISRTDASLIVGATLFVAVALGGPQLTIWAVRRRIAERRLAPG